MSMTHRILSMVALAAALASQVLAAAPEEKTTNGIRYMSGGVGQEEADAMRAAAPRYGLDLLFTAADGSYMAGVKVSLKKKGGEEIVSTVADGPMFLADLPPGNYTVEAAAEGKTFTRTVNIAKGQHRRVVLRWPASAGDETARTDAGTTAAGKP